MGACLRLPAGPSEFAAPPPAGRGRQSSQKFGGNIIGFVFQSYHLFSTLTAAENVRLALDVRGERGPKAVAKAEEILASVGLTSKMSSFPRQLSGGEQQRVAIARAVVAEPSAILADEPTAALDSVNGQATMTILSAIAKERGRAVLVVPLHDLRLFEFADRIAHIQDGSLTREQVTKTRRSIVERDYERCCSDRLNSPHKADIPNAPAVVRW